jgi:hypothetical protein
MVCATGSLAGRGFCQAASAREKRMTPHWSKPIETPPRIGPRESQRFRAFDVGRFSLGDNQELVYSPLTRAARNLPAFAVRLLQGCRSFATLDQHAERLCRELNLPVAQAPALCLQLGQLAEAGLLASADDLLRAATTQRPQEAEPPGLATVAIPTRNRTPALERCLVSVIEASRRYGRTHDFLVVDDSDQPDARRANRDLLGALRGQYGVAITYAGPEEKLRFVDALCAHGGFPAEVVRFGLLNERQQSVATGANRNAVLLHTVGDLVLQMDDDTVCTVGPVPGIQAGLRLSSQADPTDFWFFAAGEPATPPDGFQDEDPFGLHERLLGKSLGHCLALADSTNGVDLDAAETGLIKKLQSGTGHVRITTTGVVGHSGMGSVVYLLLLESEARARLLRSEHDYRNTLANQQLLRGVSQTTICDGAFCMALNLGLDNRELLPPFLPVYRNQDGVFAAILRVCFPGAYQGCLPWVVLHQPPMPRPLWALDPTTSVSRVQTGHLMQMLVGSFLPGPGCRTAHQALPALGRTLVELASVPREDFAEVVRLQLWNQAQRLATRLQTVLGKYRGEPGFWAADVQRTLASLRAAVPSLQYALPVDLGADAREGEGVEALQTLVRRFGELISVWPDLVHAAGQLRARGVRAGKTPR